MRKGRAMKPRTLMVVSLLNDLRHASVEVFERKHKNPALLLFYSFIDICAAIAQESAASNREIFEAYLRRYSVSSWKLFTPFDLWAARSALLHAYSPLGHHTKTGKAKPIFYYSWP